MADNNDNNDNNNNNGIDITLNCLIVPIGGFFDLPSNQVAQTITINTRQRVSALEKAIRGQLEPPFDKMHLLVRKIHHGMTNERPMDFRDYISDYFNNQFQPRANRFHVTAYSL